jgi:hypothetical protein
VNVVGGTDGAVPFDEREQLFEKPTGTASRRSNPTVAF